MRKATLSLAIAVLFAASAALTADAQTSRGANNVGAAAQNFTPIEPAACRGWGTLLPTWIYARLRPVPVQTVNSPVVSVA
jgi:hypothetical protein